MAAGAAPPTVLARVQECWAEAAGAVVAAEAWPTSERGGIVTVSCRSAVWAHELELLAADVTARLNAALGAPDCGAVHRLRFEARGFVHK